jgi:hypothetical protein
VRLSPEEDAGLAHAGVADQEQLEQEVVALLGHVERLLFFYPTLYSQPLVPAKKKKKTTTRILFLRKKTALAFVG